MVLFGESIVSVCWTSPLQDETPVCHDCLVVNGTIFGASEFCTRCMRRYGSVW